MSQPLPPASPVPAATPAPCAPLIGSVRVPGDKSCTQRALLLGAVADGETVVRGALAAGDTLSTAAVVAQLGAHVVWDAGGVAAAEPRGCLSITGVEAPLSPDAALDCANAGTAARLLLGLLAGYPGSWILDGDASLRRRPMARVTEPLCAMGAQLSGDRLPLTLRGAGGRLRGLRHEVAVPSAQVKSALLLAGLRADAPTTVVQHVLTRDHTERMLPAFGVRVDVEPGEVTVHPGRLRAASLDIPGDPSSAAFLIVAALLAPGSDVWVTDIGLWPRRTGFLRALERAGADLMVLRRDHVLLGSDGGGDPRGDVRAGHGALQAFDIAPEDVPDLVDEIPILALAAARARGTSRFAGLAELRVKESDRIAGIAALLAAFGVPVETGPDSLAITGVGALRSPSWSSAGAPKLDDHRLALTAVVACATSGFPLPPHAAADVSFPGFAAQLQGLSA